MRLNAQTDYSLRMMMFLAVKAGRPATIQEIATKLGLSQTHLMRVAAKLVASGFVASTRGRSGGIALAKDPAAITVEQVIRAIEPDFKLVDCFNLSARTCSIESGCQLKSALSAALEAFFAELRKITLADIAGPDHGQLVNLFNLFDFHRPRTIPQPEVFD